MSPHGRVRIPKDIAEDLTKAGELIGQSVDVIIGLMSQRVLYADDPVKTAAIDRVLGASPIPWGDLADRLKLQSPSVQAVSISLEGWVECDQLVDSLGRTHRGARLVGGTLKEVWDSVREPRVISSRYNAIVPYRLSRPLALFCGIGWAKICTDDAARYAKYGYAVLEGRRMDMDSMEDIGKANDEEIAAHELIFGHTPRSISKGNPVRSLC